MFIYCFRTATGDHVNGHQAVYNRPVGIIFSRQLSLGWLIAAVGLLCMLSAIALATLNLT